MLMEIQFIFLIPKETLLAINLTQIIENNQNKMKEEQKKQLLQCQAQFLKFLLRKAKN